MTSLAPIPVAPPSNTHTVLFSGVATSQCIRLLSREEDAESTTEATQTKSHGQQTAVREKDSTLNEDREQNRYFENETVMTSKQDLASKQQ